MTTTAIAAPAPHHNPASVWSSTLGQLEMIVTRANFDTWLRDTIGLRLEDGRFIIGAQTDFATEWLSTRLRPLITKTLARVLGHPIDVAFEVVRPELPDLPVLLSEPEGAAERSANRSAAPPALNPALTFDSFVVGDENRLAAESARRVLDEPGRMNPLTIFGASGLGKTHLLNAIGHEAWATRLNVVYAPGERFGNEFVRALSGNSLEAFRRRYRHADVVLLDDVQFFEGKPRFQDELLHTFNELHAAGKQIIVSCDRMPAQINGLGDALRSRLQWGLMVDLQKPSFETRLAILRSKARIHALRLPDHALAVIAERCCPTVRELEGYLNRVLAYVPLVGGQVTPEIIEKALTPLSPPLPAADDAPTAPDAIIDAVCRRTGVTPADLRGRSRARDVSYARHLAMYLMKEDGRRTIADIGREFGNRDHSTVLAAIQRITIEQTTRPETAADLTAARTSTAPPAATTLAS